MSGTMQRNTNTSTTISSSVWQMSWQNAFEYGTVVIEFFMQDAGCISGSGVNNKAKQSTNCSQNICASKPSQQWLLCSKAGLGFKKKVFLMYSVMPFVVDGVFYKHFNDGSVRHTVWWICSNAHRSFGTNAHKNSAFYLNIYL